MSEGWGARAWDELWPTLSALAGPRQLLIARAGDTDPDPLTFYLNDGSRIVRFGLLEDGCLASGWHTHAEFAAALGSRLHLTEGGRPAVDQVADRLLRGLAAMLDAGLSATTGSSLALDAAKAAIARELAPGVDPDAALLALTDDGIAVVDAQGLRFREEWVERFGYLLAPPALVIHAIELADASAGRWRPRRLLILGQADRRLAYFPDSGTDPLADVVLALPEATIDVFEQAIAALLAPPLMPPNRPVCAYGGSPAKWLSNPADDASVTMPAWTTSAPESVASDAHETGHALLHPGATVEILASATGSAHRTLHVLALTAGNAVEWTLDGSMVRWRPLNRSQTSARLQELVSAMPCASSTNTAALDRRCLSRLMAGSREPTPDLPNALRSAAFDTQARWYSVRARCGNGTVVAGALVLFLASPADGIWAFEPAGAGFKARNVDPQTILGGIAEGF